jgi:hypothetical protein
LVFLGFWFILEAVEYFRKESSLLSDLLRGYVNPLIAIIVASFTLAIVMETQNDINHFWLYTNWPLADFKFLNLYGLMLLAWPLHYIFFLSLFRALSKTESKKIF